MGFYRTGGQTRYCRHEKTLGQLFCDDSAEQIVNLLLAECEKGGVQIRLRSEIISVERDDEGYRLQLNGDEVAAKKLVVASGGLSMPGLGRRRLAINLPSSLVSRCCRPVRAWCPLRCINRCLSSCRCSRAFRCHQPLPHRTARCSARICCLPTAGSPGRRCCRFPATGSRASLSPSTCCLIAILMSSLTSSVANIRIKA